MPGAGGKRSMADFQVDFRLDIALLTKYFTGGRTAGRRECASRREVPLRFSCSTVRIAGDTRDLDAELRSRWALVGVDAGRSASGAGLAWRLGDCATQGALRGAAWTCCFVL